MVSWWTVCYLKYYTIVVRTKYIYYRNNQSSLRKALTQERKKPCVFPKYWHLAFHNTIGPSYTQCSRVDTEGERTHPPHSSVYSLLCTVLDWICIRLEGCDCFIDCQLLACGPSPFKLLLNPYRPNVHRWPFCANVQWNLNNHKCPNGSRSTEHLLALLDSAPLAHISICHLGTAYVWRGVTIIIQYLLIQLNNALFST